MIYLKTFKLSDKRVNAKNIYPYNVIKNQEPRVFENITIFYGNNGLGKSTLLNIIAHKLDLKGKERTNPEIEGTLPYFEEYAEDCSYEAGEDENGKKFRRIPESSRNLKSEVIRNTCKFKIGRIYA